MQQAGPSTKGGHPLPHQVHPYYRLPARSPSPDLDPFDWQNALEARVPYLHIVESMQDVRSLLRKARLEVRDMRFLKAAAFCLVGYAAETARTTKGIGMTGARFKLTMLFLVLDTLHCVCDAVGGLMNKEMWWGRMLQSLHMPDQYALGRSQSPHDPAPVFMRQLIRALRTYQSGDRPTADVVVGLMQQIFYHPGIHPKFLTRRWDSWRWDCEESSEGV